MDAAQYQYTLNALYSDAGNLESALASLNYFLSPGADKSALTVEMLEAFSYLACSCRDFLAAYDNTLPLLVEALTEPLEA